MKNGNAHFLGNATAEGGDQKLDAAITAAVASPMPKPLVALVGHRHRRAHAEAAC